jgi:hypothetical protein
MQTTIQSASGRIFEACDDRKSMIFREKQARGKIGLLHTRFMQDASED